MGNVNQCVFVRFRALYGEPNSPDPDLFLDLYEEALGGYSDEILDAAVQVVIAEHDYNTWPKPGTVVKACKNVAPPVKSFDNFKNYGHVDDSPMVKARVNHMVQKFLGEMRQSTEAAGPTKTPGVSRPEFEKMQRESPNVHLHMTKEGLEQFRRTGIKPEHPEVNLGNSDTMKGLSSLSKRITGEDRDD